MCLACAAPFMRFDLDYDVRLFCTCMTACDVPFQAQKLHIKASPCPVTPPGALLPGSRRAS